MSKKSDTKGHQKPGANRGAISPPATVVSESLRRAFLRVSAFCCGAAVMVIELAGNRILSPWFGNSLYTWTGLIGVVLISISLGYYLGGYLADRRPNYALLSHLMAAAALLTAGIPLAESVLEPLLNSAQVVSGPVLTSLFLFVVPGCLLAAVTPFATRLISLLSRDRAIGQSAGAVGMFSTLGSVLGTFGAGFFLIPNFRLTTIFFVTGTIVGLLALTGYALFWPQRKARTATVATGLVLFVIAATAALTPPKVMPGVLFEQTTFYHRVRVVETQSPGTRERIRRLYLDQTEEGGQHLPSGKVVGEYQECWRLATAFVPRLKTAAFLGGGAFGMPEALLDALPEATADVVEVDPVVHEVGRRFFRVDEYPRMRVVVDDARRFLRNSDSHYDAVFVDVFHGTLCIPSHLVTKEFFEAVRRRLDDDGVLVFNCISAMEGDNARMLQSLLKTVDTVFPNRAVFLTLPNQDPALTQNVLVVASSRDLRTGLAAAARLPPADPAHALLRGYRAKSDDDVSGGLVFTDQWNPAEYLAAQMLHAPGHAR